jgi:hypothetical protein
MAVPTKKRNFNPSHKNPIFIFVSRSVVYRQKIFPWFVFDLSCAIFRQARKGFSPLRAISISGAHS